MVTPPELEVGSMKPGKNYLLFRGGSLLPVFGVRVRLWFSVVCFW